MRMSDPSVSYVIPVHNQIAELRKTVRLLVTRLAHLPGSEVILVENGSSDGSGPLCMSLAATFDSEEVAVRVTTSAKGMGFAWRRGMAMARADTFVLTAADLPFGFTDLDGYLGLSPRPLLVMGSKTHRGSQIETPALRRAMSAGFGLLRAGLIGLDIDTQGSVLIQRSLAHALLPRLQAGDYLIGAEINVWAVHAGVTPVEVPVVYTASGRSTVSPIRDSAAMAAGLISLRRRITAEQQPPRHAGEVAAS
jgi:dolichyl-phosphate beta-glucosyltransferase